MKRTIEYRGMRLDGKGWVYGVPIYTNYGAFILEVMKETNVLGDNYEIRYSVNPDTIGQYTGLTDRNGVKIWEGDQVRCGYGLAKVVFHSGCFMVEWLSDPEANMEFLFSRKGFYKRQNEDEFEVCEKHSRNRWR